MEKPAIYLNNQSGWLEGFIQTLGFGSWVSTIIVIFIKLLFLASLLSILSFTFKRVVRFIGKRIVNSTPFNWDNILYENKVFDSLSYFFPLVIGSSAAEILFNSYPRMTINIEKVFSILFVLIVLQFLIRIIDSITKIATSENNHRTIAVRSFSQLLKIFFTTLCVLIIISILYNIQLTAILTSLGAVTAIIVLVFKDTILGFVSGVQMASTKMVKVGDWITVPKYSMEGTVVEINLISAKVENFDKTITTVPTYDLISTAVINFEVMRQKNIRRIKRAILLKIKSFRFCDASTLEQFKKFFLIHDYIEEKQKEIKTFNQEKGVDTSVEINGRMLTNIGVFRQYALAYLREHPDISQWETIIVRHLETTPHGLPLELYCFTTTSKWLEYERIQADVFDHLLTAAKEFGLEVAQAIASSTQK
ncbi:MAG: mechanosensitive ion channel family protein [Flavobacteriales bacterium AspAUS03]